MKRIVIVTALCFLMLAGCGPKVTEKGFRTQLENYRGQHIDTLVTSWGPPQGNHTYEDGTREYIFKQSQYAESSQPVIGVGIGGVFGRHFGIGGYTGFPVGGGTVTASHCETRVTTDRKGIINGVSFQGEACRAPEPAARPATD